MNCQPDYFPSQLASNSVIQIAGFFAIAVGREYLKNHAKKKKKGRDSLEDSWTEKVERKGKTKRQKQQSERKIQK